MPAQVGTPGVPGDRHRRRPQLLHEPILLRNGDARRVYFVIRQHASTLTWKLRGKRRRPRPDRHGNGPRTGNGTAFSGQNAVESAEITLELDRPTENGDTEIHIITNMSAEQATAQQVAETYGTRHSDGGRSVPNVDRRVALRGGKRWVKDRTPRAVLVRDGPWLRTTRTRWCKRRCAPAQLRR